MTDFSFTPNQLSGIIKIILLGYTHTSEGPLPNQIREVRSTKASTVSIACTSYVG